MNQTLLSKWLWKLSHRPVMTLCDLITFQCYSGRPIGVTSTSNGLSFFWKGVLTSFDTLLNSSKAIIGSGNSMAFQYYSQREISYFLS